MKATLLFMCLLGFATGYSQTCSVTIAGPTPLQVCPGASITLTATGTVTQANQAFDFNNNALPPGWSTSGIANYGVLCGNSLDNTPYFWASTAAGTPQITTDNFDVCSGGTLDFEMRYAVQGGAVPCEGPDEQDEGVSIQYSIDGGATWIEFVYFSPWGFQLATNPGGNNSINGATAYTNWGNFSIPIPAAAATTNTMFRWIQTNSSGGCCDNWGLDNIFVNAGPCLTTSIGWDIPGSNTPSSNTITIPIYSDTLIVAGLYDPNGVLLCQSAPFAVTVFTPSINGGPDQTVCAGQAVTLSGSGGTNFVWNNGVTNGVAFTPAATQTYTVNGTDVNGCAATDQVLVTVNPSNPYTVSYPNPDYCMDAADPTPTLSTVVPGTYSVAPATVNINATTGVLDLSSSTTTTSQVYTITFTPSLPCYQSITTQVTINAVPTVNAGNDVAICIGDSVNLQATGTAAGYVWDNNVPSNGSNVGPTTTTTYTVTGTSVAGCVNTDSRVITVNPLPTATIAGDATLCLNSPQPTVTFTGSGATAPYTFSYSYNNGAAVQITSNAAGVATISIPTNTPGSHIYDLISVEDASTTTCLNLQQGTATVVVNDLPTASISGTATVCQNSAQQVITFTGGNTVAPYTFTYTLNGVQNTITSGAGVNTATINVLTNVVDTFAYQLISVVDASSTTCSANQPGTATIIVNPLPTATIAGDATLCLNSPQPTVTFTGAGATAPYTFSYSYNNGAPVQITSNAAGVATISIPTNTPGSHVYDLISVVDASTTACLNLQQGTVTVVVNDLPTASISGTTTICQNSAQPVVTFTGGNTVAPYTFTYTLNGVQNTITSGAGVNTATINVFTNVVDTFTYQLISVVDASSTTCSANQAGTATIIINPLPTATIIGDTSLCLNEPQPIVTFQGSNGVPPFVFTYTLNGGAPQTLTSGSGMSTISVPTNIPGDFTYQLLSVQESSSSTCSSLIGTNVLVRVWDLPIVSAGTDYPICDGDQTTLSGQGASTYVWDNGVTDGVPFQPTTTMNYTVVGTDVNGCQNTDVIQVTVVPIPQVNFTATQQAGCSPLITTLTNNSTGNLSNCQWSLSDGSQYNSCGTVDLELTNPGCYDVTLTVSTPEGCTNTGTQSAFLCVYPNPIADFDLTPENVELSNTFVNFFNDSYGATTYEWDFSDGSGSTAENPTHVFPDSEGANYDVYLVAISSDGCRDTTFKTVHVGEELIYYVPNAFSPDGDEFNNVFKPILTVGFDVTSYQLQIYNRWGELLFESLNYEQGWDGTYRSIPQMDGTYTWKIKVKKRSDDRKLELGGHVTLLK